jgi:hypothetical protein
MIVIFIATAVSTSNFTGFSLLLICSSKLQVHPAFYSMDTCCSLLGIKHLEHTPHRSLPSIAKVYFPYTPFQSAA